MGENSKIEWCDHTFNPWIGCQKVSPGCDNCYRRSNDGPPLQKGAMGRTRRAKTNVRKNWKKPIQWNAQARTFRKENGHRPRAFCASLADVFDNRVDFFVAQEFVRINPQMRCIRLAGAYEEAKKI